MDLSMPPRCTHGQEKWCRICGTVEAPKSKGDPPREETKDEKKDENKSHLTILGVPMEYY
jgi:hypothetical protein